MRTSHIVFLTILMVLLRTVICPIMVMLSIGALFGMGIVIFVTIQGEPLAWLALIPVLALCIFLFIVIWRKLRRLSKTFRKAGYLRNFGLKLLPWFVSLFYTLLLIFVTYSLAGRYEWAGMILLFGLPWNWLLLPFMVFGVGIAMLVPLPLFAALVTMIVGIVKVLRNTPRSEWRYRPLVKLFALIFVFGIAIFFAHEDYRSKCLGGNEGVMTIRDEKNIHSYMFRYGRSDETDLTSFEPFTPNNALVKIESPTLTIDSHHPRFHGAFALYPVYAATVEAVYHGVDTNRNHVGLSSLNALLKGGTSPAAFEALLTGDADLILMGMPSEKQLAEAEGRGKKLVVTPIGSEAFVFFVSRVNTVDSLTVEEIRKIYSRKITRWRKVGGNWQRILPFQRPEGSGSQTAMERVMDGTPLTIPVREELQDGMGGIVNRVADYRNYGHSIGYSFRYYVTSMFKHDGVKLLSINGIEPTLENIQSGAYPFVYPIVAITAGSENPHTQTLVDWLLSPQGQELVQRVGYVPNRGE